MSVDSGKEVELAERLTQFHNSAVRGDSDAVNQEARLEVTYSQSKSVMSQPRWTQTVITNSDEDSTKVFRVYQDDPDTTRVEISNRSKARFLLLKRDFRSDARKHGQLLIEESIEVSSNLNRND